MSIQLQGFIIAGLYKDSLVLAEEAVEESKPAKTRGQVTNKTANVEEAPSFTAKKWFLGDNKKNIVILLKDVAAVHINDEWLGTLTKLLAACKLNLADVAIVNLKQDITFTLIKEQLQPQYILMFDVSTNDLALPFSIPNYQVQLYGGCTFMTAPAITLSADKTTEIIKTEKRSLWDKLKMIFNV